MSLNISINNIYIIIIGVLIFLFLFYINEHFGCNKCGDILNLKWIKNENDCNVLCSGNGCTTGVWNNNICTCE